MKIFSDQKVYLPNTFFQVETEAEANLLEATFQQLIWSRISQY